MVKCKIEGRNWNLAPDHHKKGRCPMKKIMPAVLLALCILLTSCSLTDMPFNGPIEFHDLAMTIPEKFVRDSVQSTDDLWIFEYDQFSEYILISRKESSGDVKTTLEKNMEYMEGEGAQCQRVTFLGVDALMSTYTLDEVFCQELLLPWNGFFYAIALRGGTEADFRTLLATIAPVAREPETT